MQIPRKMSAHNVMVSISRTLGNRHADSKPANEVKFAGEESKDKLYEPKHKQKLVRVLTVIAYIISVSLAAIVLSLYYTYIWDPSDHPYYAAKQRVNATTASPMAAAATTPVISAARTPCLDAVSPATVIGLPSSAADDQIEGTALDKSSLPMATTDSSQVSDRPKLQDAVKNLFKTLTTTTSDRYREADYTTTAELTDIPSISSDQFEVIPRTNNDYQDSTAESVDDLLDD